jgi:hypothetical protein
VTPWDAGGVPPKLAHWLAAQPASRTSGRRVLVPGCGFSDAAIDRSPFELVYERTFLCALPQRDWPRWGMRIAELVRPCGRLVGFFFFDDNQRGPPFGIAAQELHALLDPAFALLEDEAVPAAHRCRCWQARSVGRCGGGGYDGARR